MYLCWICGLAEHYFNSVDRKYNEALHSYMGYQQSSFDALFQSLIFPLEIVFVVLGYFYIF